MLYTHTVLCRTLSEISERTVVARALLSWALHTRCVQCVEVMTIPFPYLHPFPFPFPQWMENADLKSSMKMSPKQSGILVSKIPPLALQAKVCMYASSLGGETDIQAHRQASVCFVELI